MIRLSNNNERPKAPLSPEKTELIKDTVATNSAQNPYLHNNYGIIDEFRLITSDPNRITAKWKKHAKMVYPSAEFPF